MNLSDMVSNKFIRIVVAIFFFLFIYKILYNIGTFFAWNTNSIDTYMAWFSILILLAAILPTKRGIL
jgi:hypothetical protein